MSFSRRFTLRKCIGTFHPQLTLIYFLRLNPLIPDWMGYLSDKYQDSFVMIDSEEEEKKFARYEIEGRKLIAERERKEAEEEAERKAKDEQEKAAEADKKNATDADKDVASELPFAKRVIDLSRKRKTIAAEPVFHGGKKKVPRKITDYLEKTSPSGK